MQEYNELLVNIFAKTKESHEQFHFCVTVSDLGNFARTDDDGK